MEMIEYIKENFTHRVEEDKNGMKVILTNKSEVVPDCTIWFERAKRGWSKKPLSTNQYIIVDADLNHVLTFLNRYYQLDESNYHDIRRMFIDIGMDTVDKHTKGEE